MHQAPGTGGAWEGGLGRTGAAANVDMKLVKKHSQLMWKDLRPSASSVKPCSALQGCSNGRQTGLRSDRSHHRAEGRASRVPMPRITCGGCP